MSEKSSQNSAREQLKESLSVVLDGQASELELRRVIDSIGKDDDLRALAGRYQQIGETLRGNNSKFANVDISSGVMNAIEQEEVDNPGSHMSPGAEYSSATRPASGRFLEDVWGSLGKVAVAASVAFAVVIGVRNSNPSPDLQLLTENEPVTLTQPVQLAQTAHNDYGALGIRAGYNSRQHDGITPEQLAYAQSLADRATRERFHVYALQHAELSAMGSGQSILSFARLTSFDNQ